MTARRRLLRGAASRRDALAQLGGVALARVLPALRTLDAGARACWVLDLDAVHARARHFRETFAALDPLVAYALKANALPAVLQGVRAAGLGAEAGSLGELEIARRSGFSAGELVLNGNGRTREEAEWAAREGVAHVNADGLGELDLLNRAAAAAGRDLRVALRVNPGIAPRVHRYVATGGDQAKFGIAPREALAAWAARARWPRLQLDGVHVHVGSQLAGPAALERALAAVFELTEASERRGAPLALVDLGGGFGVDYGDGRAFPLERWAARLAARARGRAFRWVLEPGRWITAPAGVLLAEVLAVKTRGRQRFVVLAAGMNDLLRPALYGAAHRIEPLAPRRGARTRAAVVGPVCESADVFADNILLPPLEPGDVVVIRDAGAYGAVMSSNYNGRGRLAELVAEGGRLTRARAAESVDDLLRRDRADRLPIG